MTKALSMPCVALLVVLIAASCGSGGGGPSIESIEADDGNASQDFLEELDSTVGPPQDPNVVYVVADRAELLIDQPGLHVWRSHEYQRVVPPPAPLSTIEAPPTQIYTSAYTFQIVGGAIEHAPPTVVVEQLDGGREFTEVSIEVSSVEGPGPHYVVINAWYAIEPEEP